MPRLGEVSIAGHTYPLAEARLLGTSRRSFSSVSRPSQPTDPTQLLFAEWELSGPIGNSREPLGGGPLGHDWSDDVDTRFDGLIVPAPARHNLDLTTNDPIGLTASSALGAFALGSVALGSGTSLYAATEVTEIEEDRDYLFASRGGYTTQISPGTGANHADELVQTVVHQATVKSDQFWRGKSYVGLGNAGTVLVRDPVSSTGSTYTDVAAATIGGAGGQTLYATHLHRGNDRLWGARSDITGSAGNENEAFYSLDASALIWSNSFAVGDSFYPVNGIGSLGPYTVFGMEDGIYGFTDFGKPVLLLDLHHARSALNGRDFVEYRGWLYFITADGLKAWNGVSTISDVGIETMRNYEGTVNGTPRAIGRVKDYLAAAYRTVADDQTYLVLGQPRPSTPADAKLDWFPLLTVNSTRRVEKLHGTILHGDPALYWCEDLFAGHTVFAKSSRDIDESGYEYNATAGVWYGTTMMRRPHMRKYLRWAKYVSENHDINDTSTLEVEFDDSGTWNQVGLPVTTSGLQTLRPLNGTQPGDLFEGTRCKPRITLTPNSTDNPATTPPRIRGSLLMCFDERPDLIEEQTYILAVSKGDLETLKALREPVVNQPDVTSGVVPVSLVEPGRMENSATTKWAHILSIEEEHLADPDITLATVKLTIWET